MEKKESNIESDFLSKKDKKSFEIIFKAYYAQLVRYAFLYVKEKEVAEEVVQDVFLTIWEKKESILISTSLKSYLFRAVYNKSLNQLNAIKHKEAYKEYNLLQIEAEQNQCFEKVTEDELLNKIHRAIEELPAERKKVFNLVKIEGYKYKEVADKLGISIKTVENQMGSALKFIRDKMGNAFMFVVILMFYNRGF